MVEFNVPAVVAEVQAVFERYERALLANDLETLRELFWDDPRVVRYGPEGAQHGAAEVDAHRRAQARQTLPRRLRRTTITTIGQDAATVWTEFVPDGAAGDGVVGRQSQTWARTAAGWRVIAAHVSWEGGRPPT